MSFIDTLTQKDVETIAKGRVNRRESKNTNYATLAAAALALGGLYVVRVSTAGGFALFIAGIAVFVWYYYSVLTKKQNIEKSRAVMEWQKELRDKQGQSSLETAARPR